PLTPPPTSTLFPYTTLFRSEDAVENHSDDTIPQLSINRLTVVPFTVHPVFHCPSSSDIHNYITISRASLFFEIFLPLGKSASKLSRLAAARDGTAQLNPGRAA